MSSQSARRCPVRECRRRRMGLELDLNSAPPSEIPEPQGNLRQDTSQGTSNQHRQPQEPPLIDVDDIDDDVVLTSPRAFAEARRKAQRNRARSDVANVETVTAEERVTRSGNHCSRRRRVTSNQSTITPGLCINLETSSNAKTVSAQLTSPAAMGPTFSCPICLGSLKDGTTTKCGHIFCKRCIKAALAVQGKCPTCRKPVLTKDLIRIFLPAAN